MDNTSTSTNLWYLASMGWRDCEPILTVISNSEKRTTTNIMSAIHTEAEDAYMNDDSGTEPEYFLDRICWYGVHVFTKEQLLRDILDNEEQYKELETDGILLL